MTKPKTKFADLPADERAVGERVKKVRTEQQFTQSVIAQQVGLSRDQLASVEAGRVALRLWPGWRFCSFTNTNPIWLALGEGPRLGSLRISLDPKFSSDLLLSQFVRINRDLLEEGEARPPSEAEDEARNFSDDERADEVRSLARAWFSKLPRERKVQLRRYLFRAGSEFIGNYAGLGGGAADFSKSNAQPLVDIYKAAPDVAPVNLLAEEQWEPLRKRLNELAEKQGVQADIARALNVTRQAVSKWLNGDSRPDAEHALRLFVWAFGVTRHSKKKTAGRGATRPTAKARKDKSKFNEKANTSRRRR